MNKDKKKSSGPLNWYACSNGLRLFLVADTQLYNIEALSVRPSLGPLEAVIELKSGETSVLDTFCVCLGVEGGLGCGWGLDAPAHPSATIL